MKRYFFTVCILLVLSAVCANVYAVAVEDDIDPGLDYMFAKNGSSVLEDFNSGEYGDEVYYLAGFSYFGVRDDVAVFEKDGNAMVRLYQSYGRCQERKLTDEEYQKFLSFMKKNKTDELADWDTHSIYDGIEYEYLHFTKDKKFAVYINNPDFIQDEENKIYDLLVKSFLEFEQSGDFNVYYDIDGAEVLIPREDHAVQSVWKNGDDFRVLIKDKELSDYKHSELEWYEFSDNSVGEKVEEPEGIYLKNAWTDVSADLLYGKEHLNNYPWQTSWGEYMVRSLKGGLYLTKSGEEPILIASGTYAAPVVIPGTDWVVCEKSITGWQNPRKAVRINLSTHEETDIALDPSKSITPQVYIGGRLLISRTTECTIEKYLYDAVTDTLENVVGDFSCLSRLYGRFLQKTSQPDRYFALRSQNSIGIFDTANYAFYEIAEYPTLIYDNDHMWVDEDNGKIYIVVNEDLISLPIDTNIWDDNEIKVKLNGKRIMFDKPVVMKCDRVLVPARKYFEALGVSADWDDERQIVTAIKAQKVIMIRPGDERFFIVDVSGYKTFGDFWNYYKNCEADEECNKDVPLGDGIITRTFRFDTAVQTINDRIYIPIRVISEALGVAVDWDDENKIVSLTCDDSFLTIINKDSEFMNIYYIDDEFFR